MNKNTILPILLCLSLLVPGRVFASSLSVRLGQPKTPTNQNNFRLTFVALDLDNNTITATCYKKSPSESAYTQFDSVKSLKEGGNTGYCSVDNTIINTNGTYSFYVTATNGSDTENSAIVNVDYNSSAPGTPNSYSKEKITDCDYRIKFKTADDGGKTVRVDLFRSDTKKINIDSGGKVASISIGSNQQGEFTNNIPTCQKEYYYVIRAVDNAGNVSGIVGDSFTKTVTETTLSSEEAKTEATAQLSANPQVSELQGDTDDATTSGQENPSSQTEEITITPSASVLGKTTTDRRNLFKWLIVPLLLGATYFIYRSYRKIA